MLLLLITGPILVDPFSDSRTVATTFLFHKKLVSAAALQNTYIYGVRIARIIESHGLVLSEGCLGFLVN